MAFDWLKNTCAYRLTAGMESLYREIDELQAAWKARGPFSCPHGCGSCCERFEPDMLYAEALYLACWLLDRRPDTAQALLDGTYAAPAGRSAEDCMFYDPASAYHCTIYGARGVICRMFGFSGDRGKDGLVRWRPCRFYPQQENGSLEQASQDELYLRFGAAPPAMDAVMRQVLALDPENTQTVPLRNAVVQALGAAALLRELSAHSGDTHVPPQGAA